MDFHLLWKASRGFGDVQNLSLSACPWRVFCGFARPPLGRPQPLRRVRSDESPLSFYSVRLRMPWVLWADTSRFFCRLGFFIEGRGCVCTAVSPKRIFQYLYAFWKFRWALPNAKATGRMILKSARQAFFWVSTAGQGLFGGEGAERLLAAYLMAASCMDVAGSSGIFWLGIFSKKHFIWQC